MSRRRRVVGITGATGYIGRRLVDAALAEGDAVVALGRRDPKLDGLAFHPFDLARPEVSDLPKLDVLIHLAALTGSAADERGADEEYQAARALLDAAPAPCRFIFVSSQVASDHAPSPYGRSKARIEELVLSRGGTIVRPGLVYGGPEQGLFGRLARACARRPVLPQFFAPTPTVRPIHVDDLVPVLLRASERESRVINALGPPVRFTHFLRMLARERYGRRPLFVPVPILGLAAVLGSAQLRSLARNPDLETHLDAAALRPLNEGLSRSPRPMRRRSISEGYRLMRYLLKVAPSPWLVRRYVRQADARQLLPVLRSRLSPALFLPAMIVADAGGSANAALRARLLLALRICEASPQGFVRMLRAKGLAHRLSSVARSAGTELLARLLRPVAGGWCRGYLMSEPG